MYRLASTMDLNCPMSQGQNRCLTRFASLTFASSMIVTLSP
uniref:Uncharacterized protein n=1 Tax=Pseudomonas fluorescens (strain SBW25) TaxID=216595 RepID=A0A0G4E6D8_PSEFS|nr:hypothetical protein PQBR55_0199 [Pseudomonas fluorescens SBW25]